MQHKYTINQLLLCVGGRVQLQVYHMWDQRCFLTETDCYNFKLMFLSNTTHNLTILIRHLVWTSKNGKIEPDGQVNVWHSSWLVVVTHIGGGGAVAVIVCTHQELGGEKLWFILSIRGQGEILSSPYGARGDIVISLVLTPLTTAWVQYLIEQIFLKWY